MRALLSLAIVALLAPPAAAGSKAYGKPLQGLAPSTLEDVLAKPEAGKMVALEGTIKAVCQEKGCWLTFEQAGKNVHVSFEGYSFFIPKDGAGQKVKLEGRLLLKERSKEEIEHLEGEGAKGVTAKVSIEATGVVIESPAK